MADIEAIKKVMQKKNVSAPELAVHMGIDRSTLFRKFSRLRGETITIGQAKGLIKCLGLSKKQVISIFFDDKVAEVRK